MYVYNKLICLIVVLGLGVVGSTNAADIQYTDEADNHLWTDPNNWKDAAGPPTTSDDGASFNIDNTIVEITDGMTALCKGFMLGMYGKVNEAHISGGSLTCSWLDVGRVNQNGGQGYLLVTGGHVTVNGGFGVPNQFTSAVDPEKIGIGHVDLFGGTIDAGNFWLGNHQVGQPHAKGGKGTMDITEGTLITDGDRTADIQGWIDNGWITAYGGDGEFLLDYDVRNFVKTTLTAFQAVNKAHGPSPANHATDVQTEVVLSWAPGDNVQEPNGHDVYIGTSLDDVNDASKISHPRVDYYNVDVNSLGPLSFELSKTYYWRVDQLNNAHPDKLWKGHVWQFTIAGYLVVDDFESYDGGNPLLGTWTASGSAAAAVETSEVHGGIQAMSVGYDDTASAVVGRGIASEDWTEKGIKALYIWCKADAGADELSVKLNNAGTEQVVSNLGQTAGWQELKFDLSQFDVDLSSVSNIAIKITAVTGGSGTVYIDDIRLYPCRGGALLADLNSDCAVDGKDFAVFGDSWLNEKYWP